MKERITNGFAIQEELNELDGRIYQLNKAIDKVDDLPDVMALLVEQRTTLFEQRNMYRNMRYKPY